ncbi:alpha-glucosidase [Bifidobacterium sp. UTCIF-39]|uniref:glycoside hydrolase family 31 protein n=1 Tax=Bifidobacterium sp. UTCIF-39 TaxID=1465359 RepID=UPI001126A62E|nr:alpha-glucosidase [Bifidobacterium sp. UTCIF-39]
MVDKSLFSFDTLGTVPGMNPSVTLGGEADGKRWRIGIITESLIRFEWSDSGKFIDVPTQTAFVRDFQSAYGDTLPQFTAIERDGWLEIDTPHLHISYNQQPFTKEGLYVTVKGVKSTDNTWHYGDEQTRNLGGTARTLDTVDGRTPVGPGVINTDGWAVIDDSQSNIIIETDTVNGHNNPFGTWVTPKPEPTEDFYLFGYGHRYREAVHDFYKLTGPTPLLPRYVLGNWWSRYHRYTETEYQELVTRFEKEGIPFTTAVIDMDWHLVDAVDPKYGSGWTGYTWNKDFFPDPQRFLHWLHDHGMKTTLNVHPRDGVRAFEELYPEVAEAVGIDPKTGEAVQFDLTDPTFMNAYFDRLHHPMEDEGVDFWWIDWQQGGVTRQRGLDPLWMLNHLHYLDSARTDAVREDEDADPAQKADPRPLTFSRYAGPGSHRYPIGFSGDTIVTWESLQFQPEFTATASNIGYGWWSHDIGGHMFGYRDEELEARWYQLGTFSPINRLHSTDSPFNGKEPWNFHTEVRNAMTATLRLRHALIPYLYTMNWRAAEEGEPIVQPLYWDYPEINDAYKLVEEFTFGTELLVAPIVSPADRDVQMAKADVWLPQGTWFDFFTGRHYVSRPANGRRLEAWRGLDGMPVFAKAGAIVPLQEVPENGDNADVTPLNDVANPAALRVLVFPGANGGFTMIEDDGAAASAVRKATTRFTLHNGSGAGQTSTFTIDAVDGAADAVPGERAWTVVFRGVKDSAVAVSVDGSAAVEARTEYDPQTLSLTVSVPSTSTAESITITLTDGLTIADNPTADDVFAVLRDAQMRYLTKEKAKALIDDLGVAALPGLATLEDMRGADDRRFGESHMPQSVIQALTEVLTRD